MRKRRLTSPGATYHVVARANRQEFILRDPRTKDLLLQTIQRCHGKYDFELSSICIMDNHIHLMIRPDSDESLSAIMQWMLSVFAIRFNKSNGITGHVWYDRFKSRIVHNRQQLISTFRYIYENPIRAKMVSDGHAYRYGTVALMTHGPPGVVVAPESLLTLLLSSLKRVVK